MTYLDNEFGMNDPTAMFLKLTVVVPPLEGGEGCKM